ncbi:hypothetical protein [Candidatus Phytoplasma australiense]|uniref:hypothetical protein n=1 Tax=Phytoplasma australiense TaxID=59748 RepID=UPI0009DB2AF8|nr:hypothetical protein [Candidatus Phytoplasma australiense]
MIAETDFNILKHQYIFKAMKQLHQDVMQLIMFLLVALNCFQNLNNFCFSFF